MNVTDELADLQSRIAYIEAQRRQSVGPATALLELQMLQRMRAEEAVLIGILAQRALTTHPQATE